MADLQETYAQAFADMPLVAILRGIAPAEVEAVADCLIEAGFRFIEVPLNSPDAFTSISRLAARLPDEILVGAGTVLSPDDIVRLADAGGRLMVSPNVNAAVIGAARARGMIAFPGAMTPTECFAALDAGAHAVKIFPAGRLGPDYLSDIGAVLPHGTRLLPVGGVDRSNMAAFMAKGAAGFGFGSTLYKVGRPVAEIGELAQALVTEFRRIVAARA
ncbi:2-dehydro-3-deoxy-6-phosphogalactonate aldolase [Tropicimonas sp. IMCC34043]|uniref:2-dehydro-3-deoxy-6-phosphogalactonate aldolase n=1 Tax=Tropicimonas sp. IMCC34043 TaxID=2248760 RepID=UPI000E24127B|nr:2-dehydro-3-deoxy-6-phosphogalactonate aldolase [Tropicimonas sp. IMCC34043]